jgi:hypothetical protein
MATEYRSTTNTELIGECRPYGTRFVLPLLPGTAVPGFRMAPFGLVR